MNWDKLETFILVGGTLTAIIGKAVGITVAVSLGIGLIALDIALVGVEGIATRKMKWGITQHYSETYQGVAAISLGAIMLIVGVGFGAMVVAQALNSEETLLEFLFGRPGYLLLLIGALMTLRGIAGVIGALEWNRSTSSRIGGVFERVANSVLTLLGIFFLALGGFEIISPAMFQNLISAIWQVTLSLIGIQ